MSIADDINAVMREESLICDELRIIAKDARGLRPDERKSLENGAALIDEMMKMYAKTHGDLYAARQSLQAAQERLREADKRLGVVIFPTISATFEITK